MKTDENRLFIDASRVAEGGEELTGEVDAIDLEETLVHPFGGIRYRLTAEVFGTELLVRGELEQDFDLVCSRCGKDFDTTVKVGDFTASFPIDEKSPVVDLTDEIRESIILSLSAYPVCDPACPGIERLSAMPPDGRWDALSGLSVGKAAKAEQKKEK